MGIREIPAAEQDDYGGRQCSVHLAAALPPTSPPLRHHPQPPHLTCPPPSPTSTSDQQPHLTFPPQPPPPPSHQHPTTLSLQRGKQHTAADVFFVNFVRNIGRKTASSSMESSVYYFLSSAPQKHSFTHCLTPTLTHCHLRTYMHDLLPSFVEPTSKLPRAASLASRSLQEGSLPLQNVDWICRFSWAPRQPHIDVCLHVCQHFHN